MRIEKTKITYETLQSSLNNTEKIFYLAKESKTLELDETTRGANSETFFLPLFSPNTESKSLFTLIEP